MTEFEEAKEWLAMQAYYARNHSGLAWDTLHGLKKESLGNTAFATLKAIHGEEYAKAALISAYRGWRKDNPNELEKAKRWLAVKVLNLTGLPYICEKNLSSYQDAEAQIDKSWAALGTVLGEGKAEERLLDRYRDEVKHE